MPLARVGTGPRDDRHLGTIVFGVWLAISLDRTSCGTAGSSRRSSCGRSAATSGRRRVRATAGGERAAELAAQGTTSSPELAETFGASRAFWFHIATPVVVLLIVIDMIWKPGA